jgi:hypothetical protein
MMQLDAASFPIQNGVSTSEFRLIGAISTNLTNKDS